VKFVTVGRDKRNPRKVKLTNLTSTRSGDQNVDVNDNIDALARSTERTFRNEQKLAILVACDSTTENELVGAKTLCVQRLPSHQETATLDASGPSRIIVFTATRDMPDARARVRNDFKNICRECFEVLIVRQQGDRTETAVIRRSRHDRDWKGHPKNGQSCSAPSGIQPSIP